MGHLLRLRNSLAALILISGVAHAQDLPTYPINPKVRPRYPDVSVSNLPQPEKVKLANDAPGVISPTLVGKSFPAASSDCKDSKSSGTVQFSFIVDADGAPRNIVFKKALGNDIDLLALRFLLRTQFIPGMLNGSPVPFGRDVSVELKVCTERDAGTNGEVLRLRAAPELKFTDWHGAAEDANLAPLHMPADAIGDGEHPGVDGFVAPKSIAHQVYSAKGMSGSFIFGVFVDEHGLGRIDKVLQSTNPKLLPVAAAMIRSIRRTPAMKNGMPVPVHTTEALDIKSD